MVTRLESAQETIEKFFDQQSSHVFSSNELKELLQQNRDDWRLAKSMSTSAFFRFFEEQKKLKTVEMNFPWRKETRYIWRSAPLADVLMTLRPNCHFSHFTAMQMHDLTEQDSRTVYVNFEQSPKPSSHSGLSQENIDRAFKGKQRRAKNITEVMGYRVCLLNGKHTNYLGVEERDVNWGSNAQNTTVRLTDIERTLIDITVRPNYAGGPDEVLKAYKRAGGKASVNRIGAYLQKLHYVYPYHQAIGFYMDTSGTFPQSAIERFKSRFEFDYDFYLAYEMKNTRYDTNWKLHVPAWM